VSDANSVRYVALNLERCGYFRTDLSWGWGEMARTESGEIYLRCIACGVGEAAALNYVHDLNELSPHSAHPTPPKALCGP
jgi:hypothetical protein